MTWRDERWKIAVTGDWQHQPASDYANKVEAQFGPPTYSGNDIVGWKNIAGFDEVTVRDEFIPHDFPKPHHYYVYASKSGIDVPPILVGALSGVTGSIIYDGLKKTVTARCANLIANAVTIGFVEDVVKGTPASKDEYSDRILGLKIPAWYTDLMGEK